MYIRTRDCSRLFMTEGGSCLRSSTTVDASALASPKPDELQTLCPFVPASLQTPESNSAAMRLVPARVPNLRSLGITSVDMNW